MACWAALRRHVLPHLQRPPAHVADTGSGAQPERRVPGAPPACAAGIGGPAGPQTPDDLIVGAFDPAAHLADAVIVVGDGSRPRTAALCAYMMGATPGLRPPPAAASAGVPPSAAPGCLFYSIDPIMHYDSRAGCAWLDKKAAASSMTHGLPASYNTT
jgi:hypothetical protein